MLKICVGIAGTAKNTGKTTTTVAILSGLRKRGIGIFLTSIGYDGEDIDNITGLPKPRIFLAPGDIVATAERCLHAGTANFEQLLLTNIQTPLGRICIVRITAAGLVVTAGPNKSSEVRRLLQLFRTIGPGFILIDGALNRIAPMVEADGLILATGAAYSTDIPQLSHETSLIEQIMRLSRLSGSSRLPGPLTKITLYDHDGQMMQQWASTSLFAPIEVDKILCNLPRHGTLLIPGIIGNLAFAQLSEKWINLRQPGCLIFSDPLKLLVSGNTAKVCGLLDKLTDSGIQVGVLKPIPLLAVTVNPFYPQYRLESNSYQPAYVDFHRLQVTVRNNVTSPVYNIMRQGADNLVDVIINSSRPWSNPETIINFGTKQSEEGEI